MRRTRPLTYHRWALLRRRYNWLLGKGESCLFSFHKTEASAKKAKGDRHDFRVVRSERVAHWPRGEYR